MNAIADQQRRLQNAGMVAITIRGVPDDTRAELAARAARKGQSMQEFLREHLVELAARPDVDELLERIRRRKAMFGGGPTAEQILEMKGVDQR